VTKNNKKLSVTIRYKFVYLSELLNSSIILRDSFSFNGQENFELSNPC